MWLRNERRLNEDIVVSQSLFLLSLLCDASVCYISSVLFLENVRHYSGVVGDCQGLCFTRNPVCVTSQAQFKDVDGMSLLSLTLDDFTSETGVCTVLCRTACYHASIYVRKCTCACVRGLFAFCTNTSSNQPSRTVGHTP